jgi:hypothetical protein
LLVEEPESGTQWEHLVEQEKLAGRLGNRIVDDLNVILFPNDSDEEMEIGGSDVSPAASGVNEPGSLVVGHDQHTQ